MTEPKPQTSPRPRRHKQALMTWVAVYPTLTVILALLGPLMESWPLFLRTLLVTALMIPLLFWVVLPALSRAVGDWLYR